MGFGVFGKLPQKRDFVTFNVPRATLDPDVALSEAGLSVFYSLVLGLLVGYAVIRADLFLTGARGRRARRLEELAAHRPEPKRLLPLL